MKIDGNLVQAMKNNSRSQEIIASIVYLSKSLDFSVIAEYVETKDEQKKLEEVGCKTYQGYLYGPALPLNTLLSSKT